MSKRFYDWLDHRAGTFLWGFWVGGVVGIFIHVWVSR